MLKDGWLRKAYHQMHPFAFDLASYVRGAKNRATIRESITQSWVSALAIDTEIVTLFAKVSVCQDHRQVGCARSTRERPSVSVDAERISKVETQAHALLAISSNGRTFCEVR